MKIISTLRHALLLAALSCTGAWAQDVDINIIPQENSVNDGSWARDAPDGTVTILVTICNNDGGSRVVPSYKLRPLISVPSTIAKVAAAVKQTGLPQGWTILSLNDGSIRLSNGTDQIPPAECRDIPIYLEPVAVGGPLTVTATMAFSNGISPGSASGPQTTGNSPANDNSTTTIEIVAPLPVTLASFSAVKEGVVAQLNWATTEESNSDHFEVQRSADAKAWSKIGWVGARGESTALINYAFTDKMPINGQNFYRLKMVDKDNTFAYSSIKSLKFDSNSQIAYVYPNPSSEKLFLADDQGVTCVQISDLGGRKVLSTTYTTGGISVKTLPAGTYVLSAQKTDGSTQSAKIVVLQ